MRFILLQIFGGLQLMSCVYAITKKEKRHVLIPIAISNFMAILICFVGGSITGAILSSVCFIRTLIYHGYTVRNKTIPFHLFFTLLLIISGLTILFYNHYSDIVMYFATITAAYITYQKNMTVLRFGYIVNSTFLIIFNAIIGAYVSVICECIFITSTILSIIRYDVLKK